MRRALLIAALVALGGGCGQPDSPVGGGLGVDTTSEEVGWRLAAAYDLAPLIADPQGTEESYLWLPYLSMEQYCGPSRRPTGLGVFEAEAIASGLTPTLALVLERTSDEERVPAESVRVAVGNEDRKVLLQPATERRHLAVHIKARGDDAERYRQLVRTQLEIELCLEHKLGRAWTGADTDLLREAFLLDPPRVGVSGGNPNRDHDDRAYFGGQGAAVPALLGPPDACLMLPRSERADPPSEAIVAGFDLVPSDVWSAGLRRCDDDTELDGMPVAKSPHVRVPLSLRYRGKELAPAPQEVWRELTIDIASAEEQSDVEITVNYGNVVWGPEALYQDDGTGSSDVPNEGLRDILARIPRKYPRLGTRDDPDRYAVLLVPNWQIVDALRAIDTGSPEEVLDSPGAEPINGVAALLERPDLLYVQLPPPGADPEDLASAKDWPDLSSTMGPGPLGSRLWGYTVGFVAGRSPIATLGEAPPDWTAERAAQRARPQSLFIFATSVLLIVLGVGLRRVPDLWTRVPEVAMDYWPGLGLGEEEEGASTEDAAETAAKLTNA